jgi:hypothetical protein
MRHNSYGKQFTIQTYRERVEFIADVIGEKGRKAVFRAAPPEVQAAIKRANAAFDWICLDADQDVIPVIHAGRVLVEAWMDAAYPGWDQCPNRPKQTVEA